jgi:hypothetical protein
MLSAASACVAAFPKVNPTRPPALAGWLRIIDLAWVLVCWLQIDEILGFCQAFLQMYKHAVVRGRRSDTKDTIPFVVLLEFCYVINRRVFK